MIVKKILPIIFFILILSLIIFFVEPPNAWVEASIYQILMIFIPLLLVFTFSADIFLNQLLKSFSFGLCLMFLIVLWSVNQLNFLTLFFSVFISVLLFKIIPRKKSLNSTRSLTTGQKIPKLSRFRGIK